MRSTPLSRRSQDWGWSDPIPEAEISPEEPLYINDATAAAAVYFINDPKFNQKTQKWINKKLKQLYNPDWIRQQLTTAFIDQTIDGINKLPSPYKDLAAVALEDVDWNALADVYVNPISGPKYFDEEQETKELEEFEKAIQMLPDFNELPLLPEPDYELLEQPKKPRKSTPPRRNIEYEHQYPGYAPAHT